VNNKYNTEWHNRHKLPDGASVDQRIKRHIEHARRCPCGYSEENLKSELNKRYLGRHQDFWIDHNISDHHVLASWIADIAEKYLPYFELQYPADLRPRNAVNTLREWISTGIFSMTVIRSASLSSHSAAKDTLRHDDAARYAAHAAGQAVATAHVPTHAIGCLVYCYKIIGVIYPENIIAKIEREKELQLSKLPENLRQWVISWLEKMPLLPTKLRKS
jgi:hypothetical protein